MKRLILLIVMMHCVSCVVCAQEETAPVAERPAARKNKSMAPVPELLSKARFLTRKKPNLKAQYYGFIRSASWCVPCQYFLPQLLSEYNKMKGAKMELILLGQEDEEVVKKYMKEHDYNIPGVMPSELGEIPGVSYENLGFPSMCIVDANGNFVVSNGGANMMKWKDILKEYKKQLQKEKRESKKRASKGE